MSRMLLRPAVRGSLARVRHLAPVRPSAAAGPVAAVFEEVERDFGVLAPPIALHAAEPRVLAAAWSMLRETLVAAGEVARERKEAVAAAVSQANACPYCVQIHGSTLLGLLGSRDAAAIARGAGDAVADPALRALVGWAGGGAGASPGEGGEAAELVGTAVTFHYLNRMVNVFLGEPPVPARGPAAVRRNAVRLLGRVLGDGARAHREPGRSLDLLPAAPLPRDLGWARPLPTVAGAFARAAEAIGGAGGRAVPESVRALVERELAGWDGTPPGFGLARRVDAALGALPAGDRAAGRLALLTAFAAYRVDASAVAPLRAAGAGDAELVALTAWASLAAARRAGALLLAAAPVGR